MTMTLDVLLLGQPRIEGQPRKRKVLLGAYLIFASFGLDTFYLIINNFNPEGEPLPLLIGTLMSMGCLWLLREGYVDTAIFFHMVRGNLVTFFFSWVDTDPYQTGTYVYFFSSSIGALAIFGYEERWKGLGFSMMSFALFLIAYLDWQRFNLSNAHFYFIMNFSTVLLIGMVIMMFFDQLVVKSEREVVKKNSELVAANVELTKANTELDRFVYSASHDLRAPLSSMLGLIEIAGKTENIAEIKDYLKLARGRVFVLDAFIKQIVDYSRNTRLEPNIEAVEVKSIIDESIEQLRFLSGFELVKIETDLPTSWQIRTERNRLRIVFENIISNAIKYRQQAADFCYLKISGKEEGDRYHFLIEDNGIGIPASHLSRVFDMFYRAHEGSQGSGLGLYIVRETVAKLGGEIDVVSQVGKGSCFTILLPAPKN